MSVATSTVETFFSGIVGTGFDMLFYVLELIFPVLLTIGVIALVWAVARGVFKMRH